MSEPVILELDGDVAVLRLDDGKVNVVSHQVIDLLHAGLDRAEQDAQAVCIVGREGKLSGGFDLTVMAAGPDSARGLVQRGGELLMRVYGHPQPVTIAVTGHAIAAGALLTLSCDTRICADGPFKIGLNETAIGMGLPEYAVELARERLSKRYFARAALQAEMFDPHGALAAGYIDEVVPAGEVVQVAIERARALGQFQTSAYAHTKSASRQATIERVLAGIEDDMARITAPSG
jgi:enoyl-CoA hydratase